MSISKESQRTLLSVVNYGSSSYLNDPVSLNLLNLHCTLDIWKALGKYCNVMEQMAPDPFQLKDYAMEHKKTLSGCDDQIIDAFMLPINEFINKAYNDMAFFRGYLHVMKKFGLLGIRFNPELVFELRLSYAVSHRTWVTMNYQKMEEDENEQNLQANKTFHQEWQRRKLRDANQFFRQDVTLSNMLKIHFTLDVWKAVGTDLNNCDGKEEDSVKKSVMDHLKNRACPPNVLEVLSLPLRKFVIRMDNDEKWFRKYLSALKTYGLFGVRFDPDIVFDLGFQYEDDHRTWVVINHGIMNGMENDEDSFEEEEAKENCGPCKNCDKLMIENAKLKKELESGRLKEKRNSKVRFVFGDSNQNRVQLPLDAQFGLIPSSSNATQMPGILSNRSRHPTGLSKFSSFSGLENMNKEDQENQ